MVQEVLMAGDRGHPHLFFDVSTKYFYNTPPRGIYLPYYVHFLSSKLLGPKSISFPSLFRSFQEVSRHLGWVSPGHLICISFLAQHHPTCCSKWCIWLVCAAGWLGQGSGGRSWGQATPPLWRSCTGRLSWKFFLKKRQQWWENVGLRGFKGQTEPVFFFFKKWTWHVKSHWITYDDANHFSENQLTHANSWKTMSEILWFFVVCCFLLTWFGMISSEKLSGYVFKFWPEFFC